MNLRPPDPQPERSRLSGWHSALYSGVSCSELCSVALNLHPRLHPVGRERSSYRRWPRTPVVTACRTWLRHSDRMRFRNGQPDIESRADCERLVRAFYERALEDPIIGFIFVDVAKLDLEAHVPRIASFWETILLGARSYSGGAFRPHAELHAKVRLREGHFAQWLSLWCRTVDELFAGERAELAKAHAHRVAQAFLHRLQHLPS